MRPFEYPSQVSASPFKIINWTGFFARMVHEKNLNTIVDTAQEIQEFALNRQAYTQKWVSYIDEFEAFCAQKLAKGNFSLVAQNELEKIIADYTHNLRIFIKYSSFKNYTSSTVASIKNSVTKLLHRIS